MSPPDIPLRKLLDAATPQPWELGSDEESVWVRDREWLPNDNVRGCIIDTGYSDSPGRKADARLAALAPELASLVLDMGGELRAWKMSSGDFRQVVSTEALLARLDQLGKEQT